MKKLNANEVPKFRYIDDIKRYLDKMNLELDETGKLILQQQKLLARLFTSTQVKAAMTFDVTPTDRKEQLKTVRRLRTKIDPTLTKVIVPDMKKLKSQYDLAEDLYEKHKVVESVETTLSLSFPNRQGPEYNATVSQLNKMKEKIAEQLKLCLSFLNEVAASHVPKQFVSYTDLIAQTVNDHVIFKESQSFLYVSVDEEGKLLFTNYLLLQDVANDEGDITPHLYISVQWHLTNEPTVTVDLNHEYEVPNKLIGEGQEVESVNDAVKAISEMLELENFSSALGVVPLALMLKVDPTAINPTMFSYRDFISKVIVDESSISFKLRKEANSPEVVAEVGAQLYKELKTLLKSKAILTTPAKPPKINGCYVIVFKIKRVAEGGEFNFYDMEYMKDKFGLTNQALRKIVNIMNKESSQEQGEKKLTPVSNNLAELTKKNQEEMQKEMKNRTPKEA